ncbi:MAG: hypothetical protein VXW87_03510 [Pseudomonadota bacterium]|nr:hypothetical protein [Pseudomonadota bacterium]
MPESEQSTRKPGIEVAESPILKYVLLTKFHKKYTQVPVVAQKGEYYMPGSTIDLEQLPGFKETIT